MTMPSTTPIHISETPVQLWVVATPLGNTGDLSPRAREILQSVDVVLAEDTRRAGLLFQRCVLKAQSFMSLHDHNEEHRCKELLEFFAQGKTCALISDAGTPLMADPGFRLVRLCREQGIKVSMVPGPSAPIAALMGAGIAPQPFTFFGFLPRDAAAKEKVLAPFIALPSTLVFFERKDRLHNTLALALSLLGPRELCVARELTKTHEEFILTRLEEYESISQELKGEITVIIGPPEEAGRTPEADVMALVAEEMAKGGKPREVSRRVQSRVRGWTSKEIYLLPKA